MMNDIEKIIGSIKITDDIEFICGKRSPVWTPSTIFGIRKFGKLYRVNIKKDINITLANGKVSSSEIEDAIKDGRVKHYTSDELIQIATEIGYLKKVNEKSIRKTVKWFVYGRGVDYEYGMEWGSKIKSILTDEEKASFKEWEKLVGYEEINNKYFGKTKKYNCEEWELESAIYVVMRSPRLLDCAIFLKESGIGDIFLKEVWNYLVSYNYHDSIIETLHFDDWGKTHDCDSLHEKYNIPYNVAEIEDKSFIYRNDAKTYIGKEYKMSVQITTSIDDWDGFAVVVPRKCSLSPLQIISVGSSVSLIKNDFHVKSRLITI